MRVPSDDRRARGNAACKSTKFCRVPRRKKGMLAVAGTGDDGTSGLLGGGRLPKDDLRLEAYGTVDEASSALGLAKALTAHARVHDLCEELQRDLYRLGAELATNPQQPGKFGAMAVEDVARLERIMAELETDVPMPEGFILPGSTPGSGALDLARTVTRRAERRAVALAHAGGLGNRDLLTYLNRLSLVIFVLGRYDEYLSGRQAELARQGPRQGGSRTGIST